MQILMMPSVVIVFLLAFVCLGGLLMLAVVIIRSLFGRGARRRLASPENGSSANFAATRLGEDGFWIQGQSFPVGAWLVYEYLLDGQRHTGEVQYQPGADGHFVYTGKPPQRITVHKRDVPRNDDDVDSPFGRSIIDSSSIATASAVAAAETLETMDAPPLAPDPPAY